MSDILIKNMKMPDKATTIVIFSEGKARVFRQDIDHDEWLTAIEVPSADVVEVRHGKWYTKSLTRRGGHGDAYFVYGCSLCKKKVRYKTDFCPNCGGDMRGET